MHFQSLLDFKTSVAAKKSAVRWPARPPPAEKWSEWSSWGPVRACAHTVELVQVDASLAHAAS